MVRAGPEQFDVLLTRVPSRPCVSDFLEIDKLPRGAQRLPVDLARPSWLEFRGGVYWVVVVINRLSCLPEGAPLGAVRGPHQCDGAARLQQLSRPCDAVPWLNPVNG